MGNNKNKRKAILNETNDETITSKGICKYHCSTMPVIKGNSNLIKGAFFQTGGT